MSYLNFSKPKRPQLLCLHTVNTVANSQCLSGREERHSESCTKYKQRITISEVETQEIRADLDSTGN